LLSGGLLFEDAESFKLKITKNGTMKRFLMGELNQVC